MSNIPTIFNQIVSLNSLVSACLRCSHKTEEIITSAMEVMLHLCLFVGLSAGLQKNYLTEFHETWMEDVSH